MQSPRLPLRHLTVSRLSFRRTPRKFSRLQMLSRNWCSPRCHFEPHLAFWLCSIISHNLALLFPLQAKPILLLPNLCNPCFKPICCRVYKGLACPTSNVAVRHWRIMMYVCACAHAQIKNCPLHMRRLKIKSPNTRLYPLSCIVQPDKTYNWCKVERNIPQGRFHGAMAR